MNWTKIIEAGLEKKAYIDRRSPEEKIYADIEYELKNMSRKFDRTVQRIEETLYQLRSGEEEPYTEDEIKELKEELQKIRKIRDVIEESWRKVTI